MTDRRDHLRLVRQRIDAAAEACGRSPAGVRLIAVSKTQPLERVEQLVMAGHRDFGESTIQGAREKIDRFPPGEVTWHFIGHLQSNKVKFIPGRFSFVHSVDSARLAVRLNDAAERCGQSVNFLLQVNITREPQQHGVDPETLPRLVEEILDAGLAGVTLRGLMAIGPRSTDASGVQRAFAAVRELGEDCARQFGSEYFSELSMGMSGDFEVAIAEGATMVRVGTAVFGKRDYGRGSG